jgi:hypothetical protein
MSHSPNHQAPGSLQLCQSGTGIQMQVTMELLLMELGTRHSHFKSPMSDTENGSQTFG